MNFILMSLITYIIGYLISLKLLHTFWKNMGITDYNDRTDPDYDNWNSNSEAFNAWSLAWFVFWPMNAIRLIYKISLQISNHLSK